MIRNSGADFPCDTRGARLQAIMFDKKMKIAISST
jgi:hypothetical protein